MAVTSALPSDDRLLPPEEDYIDMDFSCASSSSCSSPRPPTEFEFHMTSNHDDADDADAATPSPADELFYKGKLLPLHLPPRLQMVEQLLGAPPPSLASAEPTPYASCHPSPTPSCCASGELLPGEYFHGCPTEEPANHPLPKKSWARRLKFVKEAALGHKMKAAKSYFKSFFPISKAAKTDGAKSTTEEAAGCHQRRSISGGKNSQAPTAAAEASISSSSFASSKSSSFSSVNSAGEPSGSQQQPILRRRSSVDSDGESSIQGAIAYCRKSSQQAELSARKSSSNVGFCLISASRIAPDCEQEKLLLHGIDLVE